MPYATVLEHIFFVGILYYLTSLYKNLIDEIYFFVKDVLFNMILIWIRKQINIA